MYPVFSVENFVPVLMSKLSYTEWYLLSLAAMSANVHITILKSSVNPNLRVEFELNEAKENDRTTKSRTVKYFRIS